MYLNDTYIPSPIAALGGDPNCFEPDWRYQAALFVANSPTAVALPSLLKKDKEFGTAVEYIKAVHAREHDEVKLFRAFGPHHQIARWVTSQPFQRFRARLHPLLLSPCPIDELLRQTQVEFNTLKLYHDFYFDVRTPDLKEVRGELMRVMQALGPLDELPEDATPAMRWLVEAAQPMGYIVLSAKWGLSVGETAKMGISEQSAHLQTLAQAQLASRLQSGHIASEDITNVVNAGIAREKLDSDVGKATGRDTGWDLARDILQMMAPMVVVRERSAEERSGLNAALRSKHEAEHAIGSEKIVDKGREAGMTDINARLRGRATDARAPRKQGDKK
jgi:hypothetical protein